MILRLVEWWHWEASPLHQVKINRWMFIWPNLLCYKKLHPERRVSWLEWRSYIYRQSVTRLKCLKISHSTSINQRLINNGKTKKNTCFFLCKTSGNPHGPVRTHSWDHILARGTTLGINRGNSPELGNNTRFSSPSRNACSICYGGIYHWRYLCPSL